VTAWGMQVFTVPPDWNGYEPQSRRQCVRPEQEVYVPLSGAAILVADGSEFELPSRCTTSQAERVFGVFAPEQSNEDAVGVSDRKTRQVLRLHPLHGLVDPEARPHRSRPGHHRLLHGSITVSCKGGATEPAEDDAPLVDDEAGIPAGVADAFGDFAEPLAEAAGWDIRTRVRADAGGAVAAAFDREPERPPVGLAGDIVVDGLETEAFEPRRGSW
jgi:hypothetical protein